MEENHDVIILGAGMSGIAAALRLQHYGYDVVILESRDRIGGRIHTDNSLGASLDKGASWISGIRENPIYKLADKYNIKLKRVDEGESYSVYDHDGTKLDNVFQSKMKYEWTDFLHFMQNEQSHVGIRKTLGSVVQQYLLKNKLSPDIQSDFEYAISMLENDWAGSVEKLSAKYWDHIGYILPGGQDVFPDGYMTIVNGLVKELGEEKIRRNHVVKTVKYDDNGVKVILENQNIFNGKYVICTFPLGVLKKNHSELFMPNLPGEKITAIRHIGMGIFHKTYLKFPQVFWQEDADKAWINYVSEKKGVWNTFVNMYKVNGQPILLGLNAADYAEEIEPRSKDEIVREAMKVLRTIYKEKTLDPVDSLVTTWLNDPFSYGAYSYVGVNGTPDDYDKIAAPVKNEPGTTYRVFFAGEATTKFYPATVHGAYMTGLREANRIYAFDKKLREPSEQQFPDEKEWLVFPEQVICPVGKDLIVQKQVIGGKTRLIPHCVTPQEKAQKVDGKEWLDSITSTPWDYF
ncbi:putative Monoamine oxidase [Nitrosotalea sinensis]|uniref:Putative Monoamine oxidase n=1 Tax=Nitrosotalea sinensis TaxID=1499975 RepID=A0A2H1EHN7_9ARCH|nr:NAD(P)/FAD-dependent oxidoreductase [Candidatus Nitrosotalea sinensis]SHO46289.1 putative Monoamine oxidase [Candidatus Nitrosotalea sinensis]